MVVTDRRPDSPRQPNVPAWTVRVTPAPRGILAVLAVVLLALVTGCGGGDSQTGTVPALVGLEQSEAVARAEDAGLRLEIQHRASAAAPPGIVVKQSPSPGMTIEAGARLVLVVSTGEP
jgi:beta-lactam-binding protein with PASTA domain